MRITKRQAKATSLDHAIELAKRHAKERRLPSKVMADLMGVELKTYYRWLLENTLPLNRIVGQSYRELLPQHIANPRTLLVLDPPYVCTQQGNYRKAAYFGMVEFLRLMAMVRPPFIFFSSTRSELPAYLDLVAELRLPGWERFAGSQTLTVSSTINRNSSYGDHLIYKF